MIASNVDADAGSRSAATVSVVIPTRNRPASLARLLRALARQTRPPIEILVVDASDAPVDERALSADHPTLPLVHLPARTPAERGVCAQRNAGIRRAQGSHVLLMDDDLEPPPDYVERLVAHLERDPSCGAVTGIFHEPERTGGAAPDFDVPRLRHLLFTFLFQTGVWCDVEAARGGPLTALPLAVLKRWYRRRGNTWSLAGWPLVTQVGEPVVRTAVYTLGAALVRRSWLLASPYDERLGAHGIGDNYGVATGFPEPGGVAVLTELPVLHHRAPENRLPEAEANYRRVLALHSFLRTSPRFSRASVAWLAWSLVGQTLASGLRGRWAMSRASLRALGRVVSGRNPLLGPPAGSEGAPASA